MTLSVSAVIISHDPARIELLRRAIASALAAGPDEVVVIRNYTAPLNVMSNRLVDIFSKDPTPGGKQAKGVTEAYGSIVAFLDDDDTWDPAKVGFVRTMFSLNPDAIVVNHSGLVVDENGRQLSLIPPNEKGQWVLSSCIAVRRSWALPHVSLVREAGFEDDLTWFLLAEVDAPKGIIIEAAPLTRWTYHAGNVSRARPSGPEFHRVHAVLFPRWVIAEQVMMRYAALHDRRVLWEEHLKRRNSFKFLAALENNQVPRTAAWRTLWLGKDQHGIIRPLLLLAIVSPRLARYALFRFNRFSGVPGQT